MAAEEDPDTLKLYWDHFFKAETGTYEKSTWLDLFLAEFLIRLNEGANPKELIKFCPVSGVVTLVGCELLCGIHRLTSSITAHCATPLPPFDTAYPPRTALPQETKPDEVKIQPTSLFTRSNAQSSQEILRKYLLGGVAWRCLVLLRALGVEGLSCCRQLSSVLIWLFGELSGAGSAGGEGGAGGAEGVSSSTPRAPPPCTTPIHQLFSHKIWSKQKPSGVQSGKVNSTASSERGSTTTRSRHTSQIKFDSSDSKVKRKYIKDPDQSSESADSNDDLQILNRSLAIKVCSPIDDFEYFNSSMRSSTEYPNDSYYSDPYYTPRKAKPKADDYMNDKHREIINSEITTFEFTLIITDLLQELCKAESSLSGSEGSQISVQCINFSLRNLCSLQFSSTSTHNQDISRIKVALTELLIVSLDKVLIHSDLCAKLINNGILPMLLRLLEDVITKCGKNRAKDIEKAESESLLKFVFGIAYSITAFFHCLLMQCRSVDKLREFTDQFKLYGECLKGGLIKECIELMIRIPVTDVEENIILIKKLIESVGKLINGMKRVRSEVIHSAACSRPRHKACRQRVAAGMHHHHDILGDASCGLPMSAACCVAVLYGTFTALLTDDEVAAQPHLRNKILRVMLNSGVCCCFSQGVVMESIVRLMLTQNSVASLCLQVLEHTVYGDLGASILIPKITDQLPCSICEPDDRRDFTRNYCPLNISPVERKSMWSFLIHYNSLLQLDNHSNVLHATVSHLLRVTPKCRTEMKYELLFSVIYPTFIVAKHRYIIRLEESAYFVTVSCLNIFASLLNTVSFAEQFIQKGGLSYVLELVSLSEFSNQCCSILEIAIIVEIFKLMKENSELTYYREISTLQSVQMLFKSLIDVTDKCFRILKTKIPADKYMELCDVSKEREMLRLPPEDGQKNSAVGKCAGEAGGESGARADADEAESLKSVCTFWRSCGRVCLYSPAFRACVARQALLADSLALLRLLLHALGDAAPPAPPALAAPLIAIVEALLTVHFSLSEGAGCSWKQASCGVVRGALGACARGPHVRALCEALVRVATAQPSRTHVMPSRAHAKVPALACPAGGSSGSCSSSEESAAAPYASEHSDPAAQRPDEGYEADVEVGKLDVHQSYKARKISTSMSTVTSDSGVQSCAVRADEAGGAGGGAGGAAGGAGLQCAEYNARAHLAHPELCIIVVDILTHLIDKLLQRQCSAESAASIERVGAQLARACRAGLAAGAPAPAPPLLQRLLAPAREHLLANHHPTFHELQRSVVELIQALAWQSVSGAEVAALLRLLLAPRPPLALLLPALRRLLRRAPRHTPDCILTFPVDTQQHEGLQEMTDELNHLGLNNSTQNNHNDDSDKIFQDSHLKAGAVRCRATSAGWCAWAAGFALTVWLHAPPAQDDTIENNDDDSSDNESTKKSPTREPRGRLAELSHVVSIGHDSLMFEMWLQTTTGVLAYRLSRPEWGGGRVLSEARVCGGLAPRHWNLVAINVSERVHKRHMFIEVTTFVNGYECESVALPLQGILVRKVIPTNMVVGHACRGGGGGGGGVGVYHLARVCVYRAPLLTRYTALHLAAHGPDHSCQIKCEAPNYPLVLTPDILDSNLDWDQVYDISTATLRELHDNVVLTFSASAPYIVNLYHQTVALPTVFGARVGGVAGAGAAGGAAGAGASIPETLAARWAGAALRSSHRGMAPALYTLGGPDVLLYLYARVVELDGTAAEQALALSILLRACHVDNRLYAMFYSGDSLDMLLTVFASPKCHVTHHLLAVVCGAACSARVVRVCAGGAGAVLAARSPAVLLQPALYVLLLRAWRHLDATQVTWEVDLGGSSSGGGGAVTQRGSVFALWLASARALLRDEHPRREFNHYQMNRVGLLHHLLLACKERFLNSDCGPLDPIASNNLVEVVRGLIGTPPVLQRVALLCDFLLLMHQASDTFVTHSRANFYFLLTSETQEMSEFNSDVKRRSSRRAKRKSETADKPSASSTSTEDVAADAKEPSEPAPPDSDKMDSSLDSTKQIKGIINMQIREGRKHTASNSTSENSDATTEAAGSDGDVHGDLTDYIVVDVDDVNHTTVEMYSAGLYHQRRVRAGAAPGWAACEGLLLLLRDTIAVLPDHMLAQATCGAVQAEALVVLANHRQASVRAAVVRAFAALTRRAPPDLARRLRAQHYYLHLANQISLYEGSWELAAACAALLTKCDVPLEDQLDDDIWVDITEESVHRSGPLLALLPCCLADVPLAHNLTLILRRIIDKASLKVLNEVALVEVVVRAIRAIGLMPDTNFEGRDLLLEDLHELLNKVAIKALASQHSMQTVCEIHQLLSYVEAEGAAREAEGACAAARRAQLALFHAQLDYLEERLHASYAASAKTTNYFATVVSSSESGNAGGAARLLAAATRGVWFLLARSPAAPLHHHADLALRLLSTLLLAVSGPSSARRAWWAGGGGDWSAPLCELFWWLAAPAPGARRLQPALLRALYAAPPPALLLLAPDPPAQRKLAVYLLTILKHIHAEAETGPPSVELAITDWARGWAVATQAGLPDRLDSETLALEAESLLRIDEQRWAKAAARMRPAIAKAVFSKEGVASKVSETAMQMTRQVVEAQNGERKRFMEQLRRAHARAAARAATWRTLVDQLTHEHAVWHDPRSYPTSWQLDPTEGPGRVRVRLRRAHLNIHPRFLKPQFRHKLDAVHATPPLRSVLECAGGASARLQPDEPVSYMARVTRVAVAADTRGDLLLTDRCLHFVPDDADADAAADAAAPDERAAPESWPLDALLQVVTRRWCLQELAVELFLSSGHAHMLAFADEQERAAFLKALNASHLPARIEADTLTEAMNQWRNGTITNWEYLMRLNGLAGRSYNDLMQYPVLPFVIADYTSKILDLNDPASFRDLSKPMAVQNKNREQHYINVYNDLKAARREGCSPLLSRQPHHYASLYSNSGGVLHYLVRVPPFTKLFLNYQDNNFDMPDRTFHSLATTWRLITNDSPTDVKELIPELFYLPELFHNNEGLNLGVRQCGAGVDSVEVPAWAADARVFTLLHRQALESPLVAEHLPHWIDLVFGYKQTGQPALDAINVFPACTYYGFDPTALEDEVERTAAAAMVRTYGQAPRQLLRTPHPRRHHDLLRAHQGANGESGEEPEVWAGVRGARWGRYCGSPALPPPALAAKRSATAGVTLQPLHLPRAAALVPQASALLHLHGDPGAANSRGSLALVTWGHSDGIVRLKRRRDVPPDMLLLVPPLDQVTTVSSWCASATCPYPLLMGHSSGRVVCVRVESVGVAGGGGAGGGALRVRTRTLHAHGAAVADICVCARSRLLATASVDGTIVLWDLNDLTYIRTLPNRDMLPVTHVTISETLCDVASVHELSPRTNRENNNDLEESTQTRDTDGDTDDYEKDTTYKHKSLIRVHTCNATFVGSVKVSEQVTCVVYSRAAEGVSVNCVAAGLAAGGVRLYSAWDLRALAYLPPLHARAPVLTLSYSSDSMVLFASYGDGTAAAWESGAARAPVRLVPALALL